MEQFEAFMLEELAEPGNALGWSGPTCLCGNGGSSFRCGTVPAKSGRGSHYGPEHALCVWAVSAEAKSSLFDCI